MSDTEKSPSELARRCALFKAGARRIFDDQGDRADMWFFELWHHLDDCQKALAPEQRETR